MTDCLLFESIVLPLLPISADALWDSIHFEILIATVLGSRYFSHWYDNTGRCGLEQGV